jgi:hypothetical protein
MPNGVATIRGVIEYKGGKHRIEGPCAVEVVMKEPGTERYIDIYAVRAA